MKLEEVLQQKFGYASFRPGQQEIIADLLAGHHVVAMLPTGGGKSICYQLPGMLLDGAVLIVSPLLSLMEDQVNQLRLFGEKRVIAFNSFRTIEEKQEALQNIKKYKFIFASPEMLQARSFLQALQQVPLALFVVDEAHCISQWGYDFRPDYQRLQEVIAMLRRPPVLAITATATGQVLRDIVGSLGLGEVQMHLRSVDRPNIALQLDMAGSIEEKKEKLRAYAKRLAGPGIIYCSSRSWAETIAEELRHAGISRAAHYHGGMAQEDRMLIQQQFMKGQLDVISCTSAFGMGINKADVRYVIHFHYPANLEAYLQEIGRAGRDGLDSLAVLLLCPFDHELPAGMIAEELPSEAHISYFLSLLQERLFRQSALPVRDVEQIGRNVAGLSEQHWRFLLYHLERMGVVQQGNLLLGVVTGETGRRLALEAAKRLADKQEKLQRMRWWLQRTDCRREGILQYFDSEAAGEPVYCCDLCGIDVTHYENKREEAGAAPADWVEELRSLLGLAHQDE
ncbi:RecQ family ATP-dependent DNA helicase [Ectobacillus ponti]|uniref:ATP-dependent DNA helicase RecQ n=1 Tax=Ectobacillus ponti TaxID=2961894 RepID=A0AA42BPR5_9BACI|nr:ATP-dependent DNA helicase RecQ [Ectobacillus ponti]MCP8968726.1 ATP-dependent DNA helicase [Ectobacillus ponti]